MADAKIDIISPNDLTLVADLYKQVFKPARETSFFERRFLGRHNPLVMVAAVDGDPVGFVLGFELKPDVFFTWLVGVVANVRRQSIGSQLLEAAQAWAAQHEYLAIRFECPSSVRPMLHMGIAHDYDIVGLRWDPDLATNLVIFQKSLEP